MYAIFVATMYTSIFPYEILSYIYSYIEIFLLGIKILMIEHATRALCSSKSNEKSPIPGSHACKSCSTYVSLAAFFFDAFRNIVNSLSMVQDFWQPVSIGTSYEGKAWSVEYLCILYGWCGCCCASFSEQTQQSLFWTKRLRHSTILLLTMGYTIKLGTCPLLVVGGRCLS